MECEVKPAKAGFFYLYNQGVIAGIDPQSPEVRQWRSSLNHYSFFPFFCLGTKEPKSQQRTMTPCSLRSFY
jgi:hypothetical protein